MAPMYFEDKFIQNNLDKGLDLFELVSKSTIQNIIYYIIDSKYRKGVILKNWIKEQVQNPSEEVIALANKITDNKDYDIQMINILRYIRSHLEYKPDKDVWGMDEYWASSNEMVKVMKDDCDGGATLMYVLARIKGVPANRLSIFAGDVEYNKKIIGHAWLGYKPKNYPLNYVFLDWCYYVDVNNITDRKYYDIIDKIIYPNNQYKNIWFYFNEVSNGNEIRYEFRTDNMS